jgi:uncharacterized protein (DUF924 family)
MKLATPDEVLQFWGDAGPDRWFAKDDAFDLAIRERFLATHEAASRCDFPIWEESHEGALALVISLDQFPRNIFRKSAHAFATDPLARVAANRALARGFDQATDERMRPFFYLPFMHSESLADQERSVRLHAALGDREHLKYALIHRDVIAKFGRFPHRNQALVRNTTAEEREFMEAGGFAG